MFRLYRVFWYLVSIPSHPKQNWPIVYTTSIYWHTMVLTGIFLILGTTHSLIYQLVLWYLLVRQFFGGTLFMLPVSTVVLTSKSNFDRDLSSFLQFFPLVLNGSGFFWETHPLAYQLVSFISIATKQFRSTVKLMLFLALFFEIIEQ